MSVKAYSTTFPAGPGNLRSDAGTAVDDRQHEDDEAAKKYQTLRGFDFVLILSQFFAVLILCLVGYMFATWTGGFQWGSQEMVGNNGTGSNGDVNFHGFFMSTAFIFGQGEALVAYRLYRHEAKVLSKAIHGFLHLLTLTLGGVGLGAMVTHKDLHGFSHFKSIHSWIGLTILSGYLIQFAVGFVNFAFPKTSLPVRRAVMPAHRAFGLMLFFVAVTQVVLGMNQYASYYMRDCYGALNCEHGVAVVLNVAVLIELLYAVTIAVLVGNENWRRDETLDEKKTQ